MPHGQEAVTTLMFSAVQTFSSILNREIKTLEVVYYLGIVDMPVAHSFSHHIYTPEQKARRDTTQLTLRQGTYIATRNIVERMFGVWKRRFHVLHSEIRMKPRKASRIIVACAVLHNLAISWKEPEVEDHVEDQQPGGEPFDGQQDGRSLRDYFANTYFAI